jgi:CBS domain-containing protein
MNVSELMTTDIACISTDDTLAAAAQKLWDRDCGSLPVERADGQVVGMITDRDICMACWSRGLPPTEIRVSDAMSTRLTACSPDDDIETVEASMRSNQIRRIPVLSGDGRLVGIVSVADIARASAIGGPGSRGLAQMLAGICQRPPVTAATQLQPS